MLNDGRFIPWGQNRACRAIIAAAVLAAAATIAPAGPGEPDGAAPITSETRRESGGDRRPLGSPARAGATALAADDRGLAEPGGAARRNGPGAGQVVGALGFVLALIVVVFQAIRRGARARGGLMAAAGPGGRAPSGVLSVLGRYPLARGQTLLLLKLDRRVLLVAQVAGSRGGPALSTLTEVTDPEEVAAIAARCEGPAGGFVTQLERFSQEHESGAGEAGPAPGASVRSMRDRLAAWRGLEPRGSGA